MAAAAAFLVGLAYWLGIARLGGRAEPWDTAGFWTITYPIAVVIAAGLGALSRRNPWFSGALFMLAQGVPVAASGLGPLWAVGLPFLLLLALPGAAAGLIGSMIARRR